MYKIKTADLINTLESMYQVALKDLVDEIHPDLKPSTEIGIDLGIEGFYYPRYFIDAPDLLFLLEQFNSGVEFVEFDYAGSVSIFERHFSSITEEI